MARLKILLAAVQRVRLEREAAGRAQGRRCTTQKQGLYPGGSRDLWVGSKRGGDASGWIPEKQALRGRFVSKTFVEKVLPERCRGSRKGRAGGLGRM